MSTHHDTLLAIGGSPFEWWPRYYYRDIVVSHRHHYRRQ